MAATVSRTSNAIDLLRSISTQWDLLQAITRRDIRVHYQGTFLSFIWWIARPLTLGTVLYIALGRVLDLRADVPNYSIFLLSALFPWFWFSSTIGQATGIFVSNGGLLKKVRFPKLILLLSAVLFNTSQFLLTLPILMGFVLIAGIDPALMWLVGIPALIALQLLLLIGLGTLLATLNVFFRDLGPMVDVALLLLFYLSAIIFPLDLVPPEFRWIMAINPVAPLIDAWRNLFLYGEFMDGAIWPALVITAASLTIGLFLFNKLEGQFADAL